MSFQPGRYGYYGATPSPYTIGAQVNQNYHSKPSQYSVSNTHWNFGQGLAEVKHSIRQDDAFRGQSDRNLNSRKHSESRQYDLQNQHRTNNKDYLLVSKTPENEYNPEQILIDQMEVGKIDCHTDLSF